MRLANVRMASGSPGRATGTAPIASAPKCRKWAAAYSSSENTADPSTSSHMSLSRRARLTGWKASINAASRSPTRIPGRARARARSMSRQRMSRSTDQPPRVAAAACRSYRRTSGRLRERARPVERRPSGSIRAVRHEKRQQPPLDAERYARGRRGRAGREPDGERFAEERLVIVERRGRRSSRPPEGQDELVLERFQLLQHRLAPRRGREERVARLHHPAVQPERARQRGGGAHPPLPERLDVAPLEIGRAHV